MKIFIYLASLYQHVFPIYFNKPENDLFIHTHSLFEKWIEDIRLGGRVCVYILCTTKNEF